MKVIRVKPFEVILYILNSIQKIFPCRCYIKYDPFDVIVLDIFFGLFTSSNNLTIIIIINDTIDFIYIFPLIGFFTGNNYTLVHWLNERGDIEWKKKTLIFPSWLTRVDSLRWARALSKISKAFTSLGLIMSTSWNFYTAGTKCLKNQSSKMSMLNQAFLEL